MNQGIRQEAALVMAVGLDAEVGAKTDAFGVLK